MVFPLIVAKMVSAVSEFSGYGGGGTWPGEIVLKFFPKIFSDFASQVKKGLVLVTGTNGKTTTTKMIYYLLCSSGEKKENIVYNDSGANLLNGLVSAFVKRVSWWGKIHPDWAILEVDEAVFAQVLRQLESPKAAKVILVFLNLFRDQLDRYGEVNLVMANWRKAVQQLTGKATLILNADDPQVASLGKNFSGRIVYFGLEESKKFSSQFESAQDAIFCPECGKKLLYQGRYFSHLGIWSCGGCGFSRPKVQVKNFLSPLPGIYNVYNSLAAVAAGKELGVPESSIEKAWKKFQPAFGRQEELEKGSRRIKIFLAKNPVGLNASLRTVLAFQPKTLLLVLNDRIPDGRDVSWIWDADLEMISPGIKVFISGERAYEMGLRMKYADWKEREKSGRLKIYENLKEAIRAGLSETPKGETFYILPTYSAMLEVRKILKGRKIL